MNTARSCGRIAASAISGEWTLDAQPGFSFEGHFTGYVGRLRRPLTNPEQPVPAEAREADRIRQLLHELRTPVTAVQGYAEVIQQQLFGPAPHEYRALAAAIAADAARILAGFDELDRLARLETGALGIEPGEADIARLTRRIVDQLAPVLAAREAGIALALTPDASLLAGCDSDDAHPCVGARGSPPPERAAAFSGDGGACHCCGAALCSLALLARTGRSQQRDNCAPQPV